MQELKIMLAFCLCSMLLGCDSEQINRPKAETRTMIIGGVPVHEHDYKRPIIQANTQQ